MKNVEILIKILNNFCAEHQKRTENNCSSCPSYKVCDAQVWEDAESELNQAGCDIDINIKGE